MFRKVGSAVHLGTRAYQSGHERHAHSVAASQSYFLDGSRQLDVSDILKKHAETYALSENPRDYLFEAIRANTTQASNENNDGFSRSELLNWNPKLGMAVYQTYREKPHHVNHKTDIAKAARGIIFDAHYNQDTPALDNCPRCALETRKVANRDESGLHCKRCGHLCKDEFVEILLGVDTKKDPVFARGVRAGHLNAGSMGCNCQRTVCNVCTHVAYAKPEFCNHIARHKGSLWLKEGSSGEWTKRTPIDIERLFKRAGYNPDLTDFCYAKHADFEARKAFEYCLDVVFDEYSRVDQPADPKALSIELFRMAKAATRAGYELDGDGIPTKEAMTKETEELLAAAQGMGKAASRGRSRGRGQRKTANEFYVVRVNDQPYDTHAGETLEAALVNAGDPHAEEGNDVKYCIVEADSAEDATGMYDEASEKEALIISDVPPEEEIQIVPQGGPGMPGQPGMEQQPGVPPKSPGDLEEEMMAPPEMGEQPMETENLGMEPAPPGASAPSKKGAKQYKFARSYRDWAVDVSEQGNARVVDGGGAPVLIVRGHKGSPAERREFGRKVMASILEAGVMKTADKMNGVFVRRADVTQYATNDHELPYSVPTESPLGGGEKQNDMTENRAAPESTVLGDEDDDMTDGRPKLQDRVINEGGNDNVGDYPREVSPVTREDNNDMEESRTGPGVGESVLKNETHDHAEKVAAKAAEKLAAYQERSQKLFASKIARIQEAHAAELKTGSSP